MFGLHRGFRVEKGHFGPKVIVTGSWRAEIADYLRRHRVRELELVDTKGFRSPDGTADFLRDVPSLVVLVLEAKLRRVDGLDRFSELRRLELWTDGPVDVDFAKLRQLQDVSLVWHREAPALASVFEAPWLQTLALERYPGASSATFSRLTALTSLWISASGLTEVDAFHHLHGLRVLALLLLHHLRSLDGLKTLTHLESLRVEGCKKIDAVDGLSALTNLRFLSLSDDGDIRTLLPIANLRRLETLSFHGSTKIVDGRLDFLRGLTGLRDVRFQNRRHYTVKCEEFPPFNRESGVR